MGREVFVSDKMQKGYHYILTEPVGQNFHTGFNPELTPQQMLSLGIFGGRYICDCRDEFPAEWYENARLCPDGPREEYNFFGVLASQSLREWRRKGWINEEDPRGWFQWYCRYYLGRRIDDDERQIRRWRMMKRHTGQIRKNCSPGDLSCRPRQRQALLQWAYDSRKI